MTSRARRGLDAFLSRRAAPSRERLSRIDLPGGPLTLRVRRHPTARRLTLRLAPDGSEARVSIPCWAAFRDGESFARERSGWIAGQLAKVPRVEPIGNGGEVPFRGRSLTVRWHPDLPRAPSVEDGTIQLGGPIETLEPRLRRWLEREALSLFETDLAIYCAAAGRPGPPVRISRARRRWGSCAHDGAIRINWRLVMAPDPVRRSVVAHEVAHLVHFDHSRAFRALLNRIYEDDLSAADAWLRREGPGLYARFG